MEIKPWLTAINRNKISAPLKHVINHNHINKSHRILDYGCGHGFDLNYLKDSGFNIIGYDKYIKKFSSETFKNCKYDIVLCYYVLNVIEDYEERILALKEMVDLLDNKGIIYLAVRSVDELNPFKNSKFLKHKDGIVTKKNTFQKYFSKDDFANLISNIENCTYEYLPFNNKTLFIKIKKI